MQCYKASEHRFGKGSYLISSRRLFECRLGPEGIRSAQCLTSIKRAIYGTTRMTIEWLQKRPLTLPSTKGLGPLERIINTLGCVYSQTGKVRAKGHHTTTFQPWNSAALRNNSSCVCETAGVLL